MNVNIKGQDLKALCDTGSSHNFVHPSVVEILGLSTQSLPTESVTLASASSTKPIAKYVMINLKVNGREYEKIKLKVMDNLCVDVILGNTFQEQRESVVFKYGGSLPPLEVCGLAALNVDPPAPFQNLDSDCKPIATKSRRYTEPEKPIH